MKHTVTRNGLPIALSIVALILVGAALFLFSIANSKRITNLNREYMVSGMGMSREFLDNIYEPFVRASNSTVSGISRTGLGMAITN